MRPFLIRLLRLGATLSVVVIAVFLMVRFSGDPILILAGPDASLAEIEHLRERWGLDRPLPEQIWSYIANAMRGEFGYSLATGLPAAALFMERLPATLVLGFSGLVLSIVIGVPMGVVAALRHNSAIDRFVMSFAVMAFSMPNFFLGILFILLFSLQLRWFPSFGSGSLAHLVLPTLTLGLSSAGAIARFARSCMLDILHQPYMLSAQARGIPVWRRTVLHALPNAAIPTVTLIGFLVGSLIAGAVVVESVFSWPGVGRLLVTAVANRDLAVVQCILLLVAATMVTSNLIVDFLYGVLDPRLRDGAKAGA